MTDISAYEDSIVAGLAAHTVAWPDLDASLVDDTMAPVPSLPPRLLPERWRQWAADTARSAGTPVDYVVQGLLAAVSAICGAGVCVKVSASWSEPLVLWLALVGAPSSGKSPALAAVRGPLGLIEQGLREGEDERRADHAGKVEAGRIALDRWRRDCETAAKEGHPIPRRPLEAGFAQPFVPRQIVVADATMEALSDVVSGNPRGVILWRDELSAWLANLSRYSGGSDRAHWLEAWAAAGVTINRRSRPEPLYLAKFPVSIVGSIQPDRMAEMFEGSDDGMVARFLYAWPAQPRYIPLRDRRAANDDRTSARLQAIAALAGTVEEPLTLAFDEAALSTFDLFLQRLHDETGGEEHGALMAGWLGKGRGTVARLAGVLALLQWSEGDAAGVPRSIGGETVAAAIRLWSDYFRPHAATVFGQAGRTDRDRQARRVVKWLKTNRTTQVGRETLRRDALTQAIDAAATDRLIVRLEQAGVLRLIPPRATGGRPARRWAVNPAISGQALEPEVRKALAPAEPSRDFN